VEKNSTNGYFKLHNNKTAHHLTSTQPPFRMDSSCHRSLSHVQNKSVGGEEAGIWVMTVNFHCWWGSWIPYL